MSFSKGIPNIWAVYLPQGQVHYENIIPVFRQSIMSLFLPLAYQPLLPALYRSHRALLFTSFYESWGMPVLEAMACGLAVVTTACGGVSNFTHPDLDCLVAETGDVERECSRGLAVICRKALMYSRVIPSLSNILQSYPTTFCRFFWTMMSPPGCG